MFKIVEIIYKSNLVVLKIIALIIIISRIIKVLYNFKKCKMINQKILYPRAKYFNKVHRK